MQVRGMFGEGQIIAPPQVERPAFGATGFVMCPLALQVPFLNDGRIGKGAGIHGAASCEACVTER